MTSDLRDQLQEALGQAYTLERELGGGGMSRVFVAHETGLGRRVVVKVLPPDLAASVNVDRFKREIQFAATLQHPHIVPVHSAGEMNGIPYYTMPFIEGESLRSRLRRGELMPISEIVRVLTDVSDALAYAHEHGVVHRDIKPDNILMSRQHAVVTDFGVAKAIRAANLTTPGVMDTGVGVPIGTPAYMAPEQAAGDPETDHRADIYAFGLLAYELLGGKSPFANRSPQEMLSAHLAERPVHVSQLRGDTPPELAALVMRCLEKRPDARPQSAGEVRSQLEAVLTPTTGGGFTIPTGGAGLRNFARASLILGAIVGIAIAVYFRSRPSTVDEQVVAVLPFRLSTADPSLDYLREGMLDLLAAKLTGQGGPRSSDPRALLAAWRRAAGSDTADLPRDRALTVAEALGAGQLLTGDISGTASRLVINANLFRVRDGRAQVQARVEGPADSLPVLVDRLTAQLLALRAGEQDRLSSLTTTSLPALRAYLEGQSLYRRARYRESGAQYDRALSHDSTFALAALGLTTATGWFGDNVMRARAMRLAHAYRDRLSERDRAFLAGTAGPNYPGPSSMSEQLAAKEQYVRLAPDRPEAWFELGDGLFHYGHVVGRPNGHQEAIQAFRKTLSLDSAFGPAIEHLLLLEARVGDTAAVRSLGRLYLGLDSASEDADGIRWRMAVALNDDAMVNDVIRRRNSIHTLSAHTITMISQFDGVGLDGAEQVAATIVESDGSPMEKFVYLLQAHDLAMNRGRLSRALVMSGKYQEYQPGSPIAVRERVRDALYWDGDQNAARAALVEVERRAYAPTAPEDSAFGWNYSDICTAELWRLEHSDTRTAAASMRRLRDAARERPGTQMANLLNGCALILDAKLAAIGSRPDAQELLRRLDSLMLTGPGGLIQDVGNLVVARLKEARGDIPGALAAVNRREYFLNRATYLSTYLKEQGRLGALAGDRRGAIQAYERYVALRENADRPLQAEVARIRAELARLRRQAGSSGTAG